MRAENALLVSVLAKEITEDDAGGKIGPLVILFEWSTVDVVEIFVTVWLVEGPVTDLVETVPEAILVEKLLLSRIFEETAGVNDEGLIALGSEMVELNSEVVTCSEDSSAGTKDSLVG